MQIIIQKPLVRPLKMARVTITVHDEDGKKTDQRVFNAPFKAFKVNVFRLPMMTGPILYDLIKEGKVKINAPDGDITYELEVYDASNQRD